VQLIRYADLVGKDRVIAGTGCGFATIAGREIVDPRIAWAKQAAMTRAPGWPANTYGDTDRGSGSPGG
jgi:hypothetical protein